MALLISNAQVFSGTGIEGQAKAMARGQMRDVNRKRKTDLRRMAPKITANTVKGRINKV